MTGPLALLETWLRNMTNQVPPVMESGLFFVQSGNAYNADALATGTADAEQLRMLFFNPSGSHGLAAHAKYRMHAGGRAYGYLYESPDYASTGTILNRHAFNRTVQKDSQWRGAINPAINDPGTELSARFLGGTDAASPNQTRQGGEEGEQFEWVLSPGNVYLFVLVNDSGGPVPTEIEVDWYEQDIESD